MTAEVIQLSDWDWLRPIEGPMLSERAVVIILPVIRVERLIAEMVPNPPRATRRSLLGDA